MTRPWMFVCTECGAEYAEHEVRYVCRECTVKQKPGDVLRGILEVSWAPAVLSAGWLAFRDGVSTGIQRARPLLPLSDSAPDLPLHVGDTPLCSVPRLREHLGLPKLWLKDDTRNPSASFKDRASALVCLKAAEYGESVVVAASTGNAATALACVAASMGQRAVILVPSTAPRAKLAQMVCYGALVVPVRGTYDQAFELSLEATRLFGWYNRNTAFNPFTVEGKKTSSFEVVRDLGWRVPDVVVVPTGDGVILSGVSKGFRDLVAAGAIERVPRLISVQASGSAAIAHAVRSGRGVWAVSGASTVADSICVDAPRAGILAVREIVGSGGAAVIVDDASIIESIGILGRLCGVFAEPAAAASLAGLIQAMSEGLVSSEDDIVLMITGHGLKDVEAASGSMVVPEAIDPNSQALLERLESASVQ